MRALKSLIGKKDVQKASLNNRPTDGRDALWGRMRRLEARVLQLEDGLSTVRRDTWRIEKKGQRDELKPSEEKTPATEFDEIFQSLMRGG